MARRRKVGVCSDYQIEDFFVCVETDDSLEMRDLSKGAYVVSDLHSKLMVFGNQEICDWPLMTRSWPTRRALSPEFIPSKCHGRRLTRRLRARSLRETSCTSKNAEISSPHSSDVSSVEDVDVWRLRLARPRGLFLVVYRRYAFSVVYGEWTTRWL